MKYIRYVFLALLLYSLVSSIHGYISPFVRLGDGSDASKIDASTYASVVASWRMKAFPWIILIGLVLVGWIFSGSKKVIHGVFVTSILLLGYLVFAHVKALGYTVDQSISAISQGYGTSTIAWSVFYLVALVTLVLPTRKKAGVICEK